MSATPTPDDTILGLLAIRPMHGYDLLRRFHDRAELGTIWRLSASQLYAVLRRLAEGGWIAGRAVATNTGPDRTEYTLTERGHQRLMRWLNEPAPSPSVRTVRVDFLSRLVVARTIHFAMPPMVAAQREACAHRLEQLRALRAAAVSDNERLSLDLVIGQTGALIEWIDRVGSAYAEGRTLPP